MTTVADSVSITLGDNVYVCDVRVAVYAASRQPAVILMSVDDDPEDCSGPIAVASCAVDPAYLTGFSSPSFVAKTYSENDGLWEQLEELEDSRGKKMFLPTGKKVMLSPFVHAPVYTLSGDALLAYQSLLGEVPHAN